MSDSKPTEEYASAPILSERCEANSLLAASRSLIATSPSASTVCADDSDITFESCDHVLFKVHRKNLDYYSEGLSPPDGTMSSDEIVPLLESGEVLHLLFQYMYLQRQPDLTSLKFNVFAGLAEAAEKYQVYAAMGICNILMKSVIDDC